MGSIKLPYQELKRLIMEMDLDRLTPAMLEQLIKYMPEPAQLKQIGELQDQYNDLAEPEQFGVVVRAIWKGFNVAKTYFI